MTRGAPGAGPCGDGDVAQTFKRAVLFRVGEFRLGHLQAAANDALRRIARPDQARIEHEAIFGLENFVGDDHGVGEFVELSGGLKMILSLNSCICN